jgi:hypothetical protein
MIFHRSPMILIRPRFPLTSIAFFGLGVGLSAQELPTLKIEVKDDALEFELDGAIENPQLDRSGNIRVVKLYFTTIF